MNPGRKNMTTGEQITAEQKSHTSLFRVHKEMDGMTAHIYHHAMSSFHS